MSETKVFSGHSWINDRLRYQYLDPSASKGEAVGYYESGKLRFKYPAVNGNFHGICRIWYENDQLQCEETYENGDLIGIRQEWYPSGKLKSKSFYKEGVADGMFLTWHENGTLDAQVTYRNGMIGGVKKVWDAAGRLRSESSYKRGVLDGSCKEWSDNGKLICQSSYVGGQLDGLKIEWYPNGKLKMQARYNRGIRHGACIKWNDDGAVLYKKIYVRGVLIPERINNLINSGKLNAQHILKIRNIEVRRISLEELGYERFLSQMDHDILAKEGDNELIKIDWHERDEPIYLLKVRCPSTGTFYTLRVPPAVRRITEAIAWTFGMKEEEYLIAAET